MGGHVVNLLLDNDYNVIIVDSLIIGNKHLIPKKLIFLIGTLMIKKKC